MARWVYALAFFILKLPVALARAPGKIAIKAKARAHEWCQPDTKRWYKDLGKKCCSVF